MEDRDLLELAAKAAGIKVHGLADKYVAQHSYGPHGLCIENDKGGDSLWNPLEDDGDALRLAVKLNLSMDLFDGIIMVVGISNSDDCPEQVEEAAQLDPYAATRRAIVRAAAAMGKLKTHNV